MRIFARPGVGVSRRMIALERRSPQRVTGWLEDDFHHFGITVDHDEDHIIDVATAARRTPWSTCFDAGAPMRALVGQRFVDRASDIGQLLDMRQQCTHLFDLMGLVLSFARRGEDARLYEVEIQDREIIALRPGQAPHFGPGRAILRKDGKKVMEWGLGDNLLTAPAKWAGVNLGNGFRAWTETLDAEDGEYAHILRRALLVSAGRSVDHGAFTSAAALNRPPVCFSFQPSRVECAKHTATVIDYSERAGDMLATRAQVPGHDD